MDAGAWLDAFQDFQDCVRAPLAVLADQPVRETSDILAVAIDDMRCHGAVEDHVFVSYDRSDKTYVDNLATHLRAQDIGVWL